MIDEKKLIEVLDEVDEECCYCCDCYLSEIEQYEKRTGKKHFTDFTMIEEIKKRLGL